MIHSGWVCAGTRKIMACWACDAGHHTRMPQDHSSACLGVLQPAVVRRRNSCHRAGEQCEAWQWSEPAVTHGAISISGWPWPMKDTTPCMLPSIRTPHFLQSLCEGCLDSTSPHMNCSTLARTSIWTYASSRNVCPHDSRLSVLGHRGSRSRQPARDGRVWALPVDPGELAGTLQQGLSQVTAWLPSPLASIANQVTLLTLHVWVAVC